MSTRSSLSKASARRASSTSAHRVDINDDISKTAESLKIDASHKAATPVQVMSVAATPIATPYGQVPPYNQATATQFGKLMGTSYAQHATNLGQQPGQYSSVNGKQQFPVHTQYGQPPMPYCQQVPVPQYGGQQPNNGFDPYGQHQNNGFVPYGQQPNNGIASYGQQPNNGLPPYGQQQNNGLAPYGQQPNNGIASYGQQPNNGLPPYCQQPNNGIAPYGQQQNNGLAPYGQQQNNGITPYGQQPNNGIASHGQQPNNGFSPYDQQTYNGLAPYGQQPNNGIASYGQQTNNGIVSYGQQPNNGIPSYGQQTNNGIGSHGQQPTNSGANQIGMGTNTQLQPFQQQQRVQQHPFPPQQNGQQQPFQPQQHPFPAQQFNNSPQNGQRFGDQFATMSQCGTFADYGAQRRHRRPSLCDELTQPDQYYGPNYRPSQAKRCVTKLHNMCSSSKNPQQFNQTTQYGQLRHTPTFGQVNPLNNQTTPQTHMTQAHSALPNSRAPVMPSRRY